MRTRKQKGQVIRIGDRWYCRYWERRSIGGTIERKRVTHPLGPVTTRGKRPPADIKAEAERHMATVNSGAIPAERIVTICDFVERVYLPWVEMHKRPSTVKGYRDVWQNHLKPLCGGVWLKNTRTFRVQGWLSEIGKAGTLSRNSLRHIKSVISGIFTLAKQQDYFQGENPARDTAIDPGAAETRETYAYTLDEVHSMLAVLPEPAATAFAVAAYMGLRHGDSRSAVGELPRWRDVRIAFHLERTRYRAEDAQGPCSCAGDSTTRRTAGNAPPPLWESAERADFREQRGKAAQYEQPFGPRDPADAEPL